MRGGGESVEAMKKTRVIDTRASSVDLSKYDERLESFVPESARRLNIPDKQKVGKNSRTGRILMRADAQTRMQLLLQSSEKRSLKRLKTASKDYSSRRDNGFRTCREAESNGRRPYEKAYRTRRYGYRKSEHRL